MKFKYNLNIIERHFQTYKWYELFNGPMQNHWYIKIKILQYWPHWWYKVTSTKFWNAIAIPF
jgi:hypothetical protein